MLYLQVEKDSFMQNNKNVNLELMSFIETQILPRYNAFGKSHGLRHVQRVIDQSLDLARLTGADANMCYVIAAYHDLGMEGPRAIHHLTGGKILIADRRLCRWFSDDQLKVMKEAVEDHRASASKAPRSIYGKIVAEADRELDKDVVFRRIVQFGLENYPEKSKEEHWQRFKKHLQNKYSANGYITLWIPGSPNRAKLQEIRNIMQDPKLLRQWFDKMYEEETKE